MKIFKLYCTYICRKCNSSYYAIWKKRPWFLDYSRPCKECGTSNHPFSQRDMSYKHSN